MSVFGIIVGFFIGENLLKKLGFKNKKQIQVLRFTELQEFLKNKFLVNSAFISGEKKKLIGVEEIEVREIENLLENLKSDEIIIFQGDDCRFALKRGSDLFYLRGRIASLKDLSELWEIVHRTLRGETK